MCHNQSQLNEDGGSLSSLKSNYTGSISTCQGSYKGIPALGGVSDKLTSKEVLPNLFQSEVFVSLLLLPFLQLLPLWAKLDVWPAELENRASASAQATALFWKIRITTPATYLLSTGEDT